MARVRLGRVATQKITMSARFFTSPSEQVTSPTPWNAMPEGPWQPTSWYRHNRRCGRRWPPPRAGPHRWCRIGRKQWDTGRGPEPGRPVDAFLQSRGFAIDHGHGAILNVVIEKPGLAEHAGVFRLRDLVSSTVNSMSSQTQPQKVQVALLTTFNSAVAIIEFLSASIGSRDSQLLANLSGQIGFDLSVSRDEALCSGHDISHARMRLALTYDLAVVSLEVIEEFPAFHDEAAPDWTRTVSRIGSSTSALRSLTLAFGNGSDSPSSIVHNTISRRASRSIRRAWSRFLPCVTTPGKSRTLAIYQPSSIRK